MATETVTRKDVESIFVKLFDEREALSAQARPESRQESQQESKQEPKQESEMVNVPKSMELFERVVRVEEEIKHLISAIQEMQRSTDKRFEDLQRYMDKRFEDMQRYMNKRFEEIDKRFKAVLWSIGVSFGVLTATMIGLFGVLINMLG